MKHSWAIKNGDSGTQTKGIGYILLNLFSWVTEYPELEVTHKDPQIQLFNGWYKPTTLVLIAQCSNPLS